MPPARRFPSPGWFTSEGIIHTAIQVIFFLNTTQAWTYAPAKYTAIAQALIGGLYSIGRGISKRGTAL